MRVSDEILKCICFVSGDPKKITDYRGTAFIVSIPHNGTVGMLHLVTAKHVAVRIQDESACFGINALDGLPRWMTIGKTPWFYHPTDASVDVAVLPMASAALDQYIMRSIPIKMFATRQRIVAEGIGLGDETASVGLFRPYSGEVDFLEPIVRTGNVAMMPRGRIPNDTFGSMEAYLVEGRSMGGLSGAPVFVRTTVDMTLASTLGEPAAIMSGLGGVSLLGLIHGHWDTPPDFSDPVPRSVNMGVSIVVPAEKILEVLFGPELVAKREEIAKRFDLS